MLLFVRPEALERLSALRLKIGVLGDALRLPLSLASFAVFAMLVAAGFFGSRDPLSNPLPLTVWTLLWVGLTLVQGLFGNLWYWINPWYGPWRIGLALLGRSRSDPPPLKLPAWLGMWPAVLLLVGFAWFELIYPAPDDPARLAMAAGLYWLLSFAAMLAFGDEAWSRRGEFLSVFFGMVSHLGVVQRSPADGGRITLCLPGAKLSATPALPVSGVLFLLAALASVSFDGLSKTFFWLGSNGAQPARISGPHGADRHQRRRLAGGLCARWSLPSCSASSLGERLARSRQQLLGSGGNSWSGRSCRSRSPTTSRTI